MTTAVIREWGKVVKSEIVGFNSLPSKNRLELNAKAWFELADLIEKDCQAKKYMRITGRDTISIRGYVGVISTSDGLQIEILPKIDEDSDIRKSRAILWKMLCVKFDLPYIESTEASLKIQDDTPLPEVLLVFFLEMLVKIIRRGMRKDYERIEAEERFLKGQLQVAKQLRQPVGRQHLFNIEYDVFSANRAENRLIHSALIRVAKWTASIENQKLARELRFAFDEVPTSTNIKSDFGLWRTSRDMNYYQPLLPWLRLILNMQSPFAIHDKHHGLSFLFPMEKLFEKYVAYHLGKQLHNGHSLKEQLGGKYLAKVDESNVFKLKPDLGVFYKGECKSILDSKWKLIDASKTYSSIYDEEKTTEDLKRGVSQSDMYQLFAYGHAFQNGQGHMALIYPKWKKFQTAVSIKPFLYLGKEELTLSILPFDLTNDCLDCEGFELDCFIDNHV